MSIEHIRAIKSAAGLPRPKKVYKIAKKSAKRLKQEAEYKEVLKQDEAFYKEIYNASPHECQNCGIKLPKTPYNWMFHHLLEKRNYPQFRHSPENIMILCLTCHSKAETNIDFAPRIKQRRLEAENNCHKWQIEMD